MSRYTSSPLLAIAVVAIVLSAASQPTAQATLQLPDIPYRYADLELPPHLSAKLDNTPSANPLTDSGATLGRVLFYDTRLSANRSTSCGSCHIQAHAFAEPRPVSRGFQGAHTDRRAMPLVNLRYYQRARFFWDERAASLEEAVVMPIASHIEMGQDLGAISEALALCRSTRTTRGKSVYPPRIRTRCSSSAFAIRPLVYTTICPNFRN